uniref:Olfactory receptor n=1 Tax=Ursus maritimus TaxID=29073 RepID=A0A452T2N5_URSMA
MEGANLSVVTEFLFTGFPKLQDGGLLYFFPLLSIYIFIVIGNLLIFFAVRLDTHLHNPMYHFISIFSFLEIWYTTATIPKMLSNLISSQKTISFIGCLLQMYFFHSLGNTEGALLTVMAIDRYLAICNPLRYPTIMTPRLCTQLSAGSCVFGFLILLPEIVWISTLPFCGPNQIHQIFCDFTPLLHLACADASMILVQDVVHALAILITGLTGTFLLILTTYVFILSTVFRIPSAEGKQKAFSTCASHLTVVIVHFGFAAIVYLKPEASGGDDTLMAVPYTVITPFLSPLIFSLRNKDMKNALRKVLGKRSFLNK